MTTLRDRLGDLADDVAATSSPPDLWRRGRREQRQRAAATAVTVLAVALVATAGAAGLAGRTLHQVEPAAPSQRTVLPDRFFEPSGRLPVARGGTGPLVAVTPADRFSWIGRGAAGLVGVSAVDQSYAFLDVPGWIGIDAGSDSFSLSPNGRWVAYWYGDRRSTLPDHPADGIAVLDTTTGKVRRHGIDSELGTQPEPVTWTGDTLWFGRWDYTALEDDGSSARLVATYAWPLDQGAPHLVDDPHQLVAGSSGPAGVDGFLAAGKGGFRAVFGEDDLVGGSSAWIRVSVSPDADAATSPDGRAIAVGEVDEGQHSSRVMVGTLDGEQVQLSLLPADVGGYARVVGWLDDQHLIVADYAQHERRLVSADVTTGETRVLSTFEVSYNDYTEVATDLLRSPVVHARRPPHGHDPRLVAGSVGLGVLVLLWTGLVVRRRRARA